MTIHDDLEDHTPGTVDEFIAWAIDTGCGHRTVIRWNEDGSGFCDACGKRVWRVSESDPRRTP